MNNIEIKNAIIRIRQIEHIRINKKKISEEDTKWLLEYAPKLAIRLQEENEALNSVLTLVNRSIDPEVVKDTPDKYVLHSLVILSKLVKSVLQPQSKET